MSFLGAITPYLYHIVTEEPFGETARKFLAATWPTHLFVTLLAAGFAYVAHRHRVAHRLSRSYVWMTFVVLFGLPGFVGYLLHRRWPVRYPPPAPQLTGAEVTG